MVRRERKKKKLSRKERGQCGTVVKATAAEDEAAELFDGHSIEELYYDPNAPTPHVIDLRGRHGYRCDSDDSQLRRGTLLCALRRTLSEDVEALCRILDNAARAGRPLFPDEAQNISDDVDFFSRHRRQIANYLDTYDPPKSRRQLEREAKQAEQRRLLAEGARPDGYNWESWTV